MRYLAKRNPSIKCLRISGIEEHAAENGVSSRSQDVYQQKYQEIVQIAAILRGGLVRISPNYLTFTTLEETTNLWSFA